MTNGVRQGTKVKTAISISRGLADEADALASEMGVSRSGLYAIALREFMKRRESASLLERLNDAYREPDPEDETLLRDAKGLSRRMLDEYEQ